jgi:hypothetical protein
MAVATVATATVLVAAPVGAVTPARDRIAVGDSVMLGARPALKERGFAVDAAVSRQSYSAPALLRAKGRGLPRNVVVHLGTNGSFPLETCRKLVRTAGPDRRVFLVTVSVPRSWEAANNRVLRSCARSFAPDRVTVVDWKAVAQRNPGWFYSDRVHLKPAGAEAFARLIDTAVDAVDERAGRAR